MLEFTRRAKRVLNEFAQEESRKLNCESITADHIFLALLKEDDSVATKIIKNLTGNTLDEIKSQVISLYKSKTSKRYKDKYQKLIEESRLEAKKLKNNYIGTEHILLASLKELSKPCEKILNTFNLNYETVKKELLRIIGNQPQSSSKGDINPFTDTQFILGGSRGGGSSSNLKEKKAKASLLAEFGKDLTDMAQKDELDPIIGREEEIQRLIQILCRKTKNNPVLVGESGVGKTAIIEGLALAIVQKSIPDLLFNKKVISLDLAGLVAGTKYRGEFEERIKKIVAEVQNSKNVIIFIDELHTIIGAGAAEGAVDAANILKPALSRGEFQCIGATTLNEYRKYIEKDSALERRFQKIKVAEPSIDNAIKILKGLKKSYEKHHKVVYSDESLEKAVKLSARYITDRYLPDKAIDIIDEAGSKVRLKNCKRPKKIDKLEIDIKTLTSQEEEMVRIQEYEKAAKARDEVKKKELELDSEIKKWEAKMSSKSIQIEDDDILSIVSKWTNIPLTKIEKKEGDNLLNIEKIIKSKIIGQDEAISKIARSLRIARTGFKDENRPSGSFIFLGPTGVGKTELARVVTEFLFGSSKKIFRLDMSEYMEAHSVSRLIGSPPGYVGHEEGGQLTEFVRKNPYSLILLDEIEKAHQDIYNILLQIMEEGSLTDSKGTKVNFKDVILIITSNIGARSIQDARLGFDFSTQDKDSYKSEKSKDELKKFFNPEFLNRLDDIIYFKPLSKDSLLKIIDIIIDNYNKRLKDKNILLTFSTEAKEYILNKGYNEKFGARPLKRVFHDEIEDYLAIRSLKGAFKTYTHIRISLDKSGKIEFLETNENEPEKVIS